MLMNAVGWIAGTFALAIWIGAFVVTGFSQIRKLIRKTAATFEGTGTRQAITQFPLGDMFD